VRNLTVRVPVGGAFARAVDDVDFELSAGEALALVGESGCGKTLTGRALVGLAPESARVEGSIRLHGTEMVGSSEEEWRSVRGREIALVFQEPGAAFDPVTTIGSQIIEAVRAHRAVGRREARAIARERLHEVGFPDPDRGMEEYSHRLSGGLKQRAFLAMALASDPRILVADEPTTALDATVAAQVLELLDRLRRERGLAILLISHDLGVVARHADRVLVMYAGRVAESTTSQALFRTPRHPYTAGRIAAALDTRSAARPAPVRRHSRRGAGAHVPPDRPVPVRAAVPGAFRAVRRARAGALRDGRRRREMLSLRDVNPEP
jgi:peptide/nickel transport system ATP-binding protein